MFSYPFPTKRPFLDVEQWSLWSETHSSDTYPLENVPEQKQNFIYLENICKIATYFLSEKWEEKIVCK